MVLGFGGFGFREFRLRASEEPSCAAATLGPND